MFSWVHYMEPHDLKKGDDQGHRHAQARYAGPTIGPKGPFESLGHIQKLKKYALNNFQFPEWAYPENHVSDTPGDDPKLDQRILL